MERAAQPTVPAFQPSQAQVGPVPAGQIRVRGLSNDTTANMNWVEVRTSDLTPEYVRLNSEYTT